MIHVYIFFFAHAGVPDRPAEEDYCSLRASECWAGGQESVCQRGTITQQSHVYVLASLSVKHTFVAWRLALSKNNIWGFQSEKGWSINSLD